MSFRLIICSREPIRTRIIHSIYAALEKLFMDFMHINQNSLQLYLYTLFWLWLLCYWLVFYSWGGCVELSIGSFDANLLTTSPPLTCKCFSQSSSLSSGETTKSLEFRKWPETGETAKSLEYGNNNSCYRQKLHDHMFMSIGCLIQTYSLLTIMNWSNTTYE